MNVSFVLDHSNTKSKHSIPISRIPMSTLACKRSATRLDTSQGHTQGIHAEMN